MRSPYFQLPRVVDKRPTTAWEVCSKCGSLFKPGTFCKNCNPAKGSLTQALLR